jgi:hypothetical protein
MELGTDCEISTSIRERSSLSLSIPLCGEDATSAGPAASGLLEPTNSSLPQKTPDKEVQRTNAAVIAHPGVAQLAHRGSARAVSAEAPLEIGSSFKPRTAQRKAPMEAFTCASSFEHSWHEPKCPSTLSK